MGQKQLMLDLALPPAGQAMRRRSRFPDEANSAARVRGRLRREARDFFPDGYPPNGDTRRALHMLYAMCDYLDDAMSDPLGIEQLAGGGANVWVLGFMGFRISAELNVVSMLANEGGRPKEVEGEFDLSRPLETMRPYQLIVECLYPALVPDGESFPYAPLEKSLREWLARSAKTIMQRDPAFRKLISRTLPMALRLPEPIHTLCLQSRPRPNGPSFDSQHARAVIAHQDKLSSLARENPRLMPLWMAFIGTENVKLNSDDPVRQLKTAFLKAGHTEAAWRYVCRYGARLFKVPWLLTQSQPAFEVALRYLAALQAAGLPPPPPPSVAVAWLKAFNEHRFFGSEVWILEKFHRSMKPKILRAALNEAHRRRHDPELKEFIPEFLGVCWWSEQTNAQLDKNQIHAGWPWLVNQWKAEQSVQEVLAAANSINWTIQVDAMSIGPWQVIPLNSSEALTRESFAMRNCLRDHIVGCAAGAEEYYSVRDRITGKRQACIGFHFDESGNGSFVGVKGFANSEPRSEMIDIAMQLQDLISMTTKTRLNQSSSVTDTPTAVAGANAIQLVATTQGLTADNNAISSKFFVVKVDDNFHYMDEDERWTLGVFSTLELAIEACKRVVDQSLQECFEPGISAERLLAQYKSFGDDPFIVGGDDSVKFSAWDYAAQRCQRMADPGNCK